MFCLGEENRTLRYARNFSVFFCIRHYENVEDFFLIIAVILINFILQNKFSLFLAYGKTQSVRWWGSPHASESTVPRKGVNVDLRLQYYILQLIRIIAMDYVC